MLRLPIINVNRNGVKRIFIAQVSKKNASKIREGVVLKGYNTGDIISNGISFNESVYNIPGGEPNKTVNFLRYFKGKSDKSTFMITTKEYNDSTLYDLYKVEMPSSKICAGTDNLLGSVILDMKNEIPGNEKGRIISLKKLGIDRNITDDKLDLLEQIVKTEKDSKRRIELMQLNGVSDLKNIVDYLKEFKFEIISGTTMKVDDYKNILNSFELINTKETKALSKFYNIAIENKEVYDKLSRISKIIYNKPLGLIENSKKSKVLVKTMDSKKTEATRTEDINNLYKNAA